MADTMFIDGTTTVVASWLNDVNDATYTTVPAHSATLASGVVLKDSSTGGAQIPSGTTAQRPGAPVGTLLRYNTTISKWEGYNGSVWGLLASGFASSGANSDITSLTGLTTPISLIALRSYLSGLILSTVGSSATMSITAGVAMDSTNSYLIQLSSTISKTTSSWAAGSGNGGLDTGSTANNTWYHWHVIRRPDTGVVDVLFSLSASSPTLPANYTQSRRIGSGKTNGSAQWTKFVQDGDNFHLDVPVLDIDVTGPFASAVTRTLASIPTGVRVKAKFNYGVYDTTNGGQIGAIFSDLSVADAAPSTIVAPLTTSSSYALTNVAAFNQLEVWTNTSAQIRSRITAVSGTCFLKIATLGWTDLRGKDV